MKLIKLAAASLNQTALDWQQNQAHILSAITQAQNASVDVLCLPELCICGYGCEDTFLSQGLQQQALQSLQEIIPKTQGLIVALGLPILHQNRLYNCIALVADTEIKGIVPKRFLPNDGIHYESRWFHVWQAGKQTHIDLFGKSYPFGDLYFDCDGIRIGFEICEDAWVAERPGRDLAQVGIDIILNPTASHFAFNKRAIRQHIVTEGSRAFNCSYVYANLLGNEAGRIIYDGDTLIASGGQLQAAGPRLSFAPMQLSSAVVDLDLQRLKQAHSRASLHDTGIEAVACAYQTHSHQPPLAPKLNSAAWEDCPELKEEEFTRAVALGLYDYLRKSYANGFVLSLSGGADSGAIASLIYYMMQLGIKELGLAGFCAQLPRSLQANTAEELMPKLLACAYQSTRHSSDTTENAAEGLAKALGATYHRWSVDAQVAGYSQLITEQIGRDLNWTDDDIALQNIQARSRAPGIWMLTNVRNALLLATSNRSEAAVGYATMDGDTSGGLSPLAGIDKPFIRAWLCWAETQGPDGLMPIPALKAINRQQPTAELRPGAEQTDEADLMPYDLLNEIEAGLVRDKRSPMEILRQLQVQFPQYQQAQLIVWIKRFFQLWTRNQWKRERYAPSFHLDDRNLDPNSACRFPILSGGWQRELAQLDEFA